MRLGAAVALGVGLVGGMAGCGGNSILARSGGGSGGLILADSVTQTHYRLSVADGATTLTGVGSSGPLATDAGLIDGVTGARYWLAVNGGALTLVAGSSAGGEGSQIGIADTVTAKTYALAVVNGALTLTPE